MVRLRLKKNLEGNPDLCLGFREIELLFNLGPFKGGGDCLLVKADGEVTTINSNDVIFELMDLEAYDVEG